MVLWNPQDIVAAVVGGTLIAASASLNMLFFGRVTGISGIFNSVFKLSKETGFFWKFSFFMGLVTIPLALYRAYGYQITINNFTFVMYDRNEDTVEKLSLAGWIVGGILVGVGTRMGNGCTSGHGVCGIPRLSKRSIAATCTFILFGMLMATLRYNFPFLVGTGEINQASYDIVWKWLSFGIYLALAINFVIMIISHFKRDFLIEYLLNFLIGSLFGLGLVISGMARVSKVVGFLILDPQRWDPSLIFVMMSAVCINFFTFKLILKR